ncbi:MAG: signal peptidase I [Eubacterium sp.]|nr:signal peptidase I [Eubacterium sp.]
MSETKRKLKTIGRILLLAVISLVIGIRLYNWNAQTLAGNAMPMPFGWGFSVVLSGSMEPTLSVNDLVVVHEQSGYGVDDIVVYQDESMLVIHKIVSVDGDEIVTKGDANEVNDSPISVSDIKGKAVFHIPFIGALIRFLKTPVGFILIIAAMIVLFELPHMKERKKAYEDKEKIIEEIKRLKGE